MKKYPKIENIFERDTYGSKKLIEGRFRNETVEYLSDNQWICTEKIDGTNIGIVWDGHRVSYQGRTERAQIPAHLMNKLLELFGGIKNEELFEQRFNDTPVILFGEGYGTKIQKGEKYREDVSFILFDVYLPEINLWLDYDRVKEIAKLFNIDAVPVVLEGTLDQAVKFVKTHPKSNFGTADMEGLVCKPKVNMLDKYGNRIVVKVKACDFTEEEG